MVDETLNKEKKQQDTATQIYRTLKHEILTLQIKPGEDILESTICARFSASRTPVREAFKRLQITGLITTIPYRGSIASLLNYDTIKQVIFMRGIVEAEILKSFTMNVDLFQIEELRYRLNIQKLLLEQNCNSVDFYKEDKAFHFTWFKYQKKELIWKIIQRSQIHYSRFRLIDLDSKKTFSSIVNDHQELFNAIEKKDDNKATQMIINHLQSGLDRVGSHIKGDYASFFTEK